VRVERETRQLHCLEGGKREKLSMGRNAGNGTEESRTLQREGNLVRKWVLTKDVAKGAEFAPRGPGKKGKIKTGY